jgi:hypothetical protein
MKCAPKAGAQPGTQTCPEGRWRPFAGTLFDLRVGGERFQLAPPGSYLYYIFGLKKGTRRYPHTRTATRIR